MEESVSDLLVKWGYPDLVHEFAGECQCQCHISVNIWQCRTFFQSNLLYFTAQEFDIESLFELDSESLSVYVPSHGPRLKLLKKIRELQQSYQVCIIIKLCSQTSI